MSRLTDFSTLTFDCYGTLIDWERGILAELKPWAQKHRRAIDDGGLLEAAATFGGSVGRWPIFADSPASLPYIERYDLVTGGGDDPVQSIAKEILDYRSVVESLLDRDLGIEKYFSDVAIKQVRRSAGYPVAALMPQPEP
jgi:hypothetical protein